MWWRTSSLQCLSMNEWIFAPTAFCFTSPRLRENLQSSLLHNVCLLDTCKCFLCWYISSVIYLTWITRCFPCPTVVKCQNPSCHNRCMDTFLAESHSVMDDRIIEFFIQLLAYHTDPALGLMPRRRIASLQMTWAFYLHCRSYFRTMNSQYCKMGILMSSDFWNSSGLLKHVLVIFVPIFLVIGQSEPGLLFMPLRNVGMCLIIDL